MTFEDAKAVRDQIEAEVAGFTATLNAFPKSDLGLTSDATRATMEWKVAQSGFTHAFSRLRSFNSQFTKAFAKELRAERNMRRNHG